MTDTATTQTQAVPAQEGQVKIGVQLTYLKTQRCECPNVPAIFKNKWEPEITTELSIHTQRSALTHQMLIF